MARPRRTADHYRAVNELCARIIAADPAKYQPGSLPAMFALLVLSRVEAPPADAEAGPLFRQRAA
jgi:hypothetical protein